MSVSQKHEHYDLLNLLGYGLAKFDIAFIECFGFQTKQDFYNYFVKAGIVKTPSTVKNRQDLFDPFFENPRQGWWQKGDAYIHRKLLIDSLFGDLEVSAYAEVVKLSLSSATNATSETEFSIDGIRPIQKSRYKKMQATGIEAECFFSANFSDILQFKGAELEDARLFGDGYDFQVETPSSIYLAEVKGVRKTSGGIRLTENEFIKAEEYAEKYSVIVVSNLDDIPKMTPIFNPIKELELTKESTQATQVFYRSENLYW